MVIKYSLAELNAIGEMVLIQECISRVPQYHQVYMPDSTTNMESAQMNHSLNSISADNFLQDYAQFQHHLDQSIQLNRDISWQQQHTHMLQRQKQEQLTDSVAEFFKKAQQNFHPQTNGKESITKARRLSEVEAELLGQLRGHING